MLGRLNSYEFRKNYPVRGSGKITQHGFGGVGLQKAGSDLLLFGKNRALTPSAIQGSAIRLMPQNL